MSLEKLANASAKNRAEYSQLSSELGRLEKEKQNELRMFNNEIQRFKARYSKSNFNTDSSEASNVKMYETHNPGFCFKRNGEHRVQEVVESTPLIDFEHLHFLLFTDGEVDIEKILCLHLLSSHETDHLTPPRRPRTSSTKKDSPLEQLIERSKDSPKDPKLQAILPTYILDVYKANPKRTLLDERLSARLLVNEKILELITTVITALENSNPEKVRHLISLAENPSSLKRIFRKQQIQDFVMTLKNHSLVNSCSSFILTQPRKLKPHHIEIRTTSGALEDLVQFIRSNVLQFPKRESWSMLETESRELVIIEDNTEPSKSSISSSKKPSIVSLPKPEAKIEDTTDYRRFRRKDIDYIKKNIESIPTYRRSEDQELTKSKPKRKRNSSDSTVKKSENSDDTGSKNSNSKRLSFDLQSSKKSSRSRSLSTDIKREQTNEENEAIKVHLKQSTCPACMEKWKIPLPDPKIPKFVLKSRSNSAASSAERLIAPIVKTDSVRKLGNMIEKEQYKLSSYDVKYSNAKANPNPPKKKESQQTSSLDLVALNILDLEKIRHEIRDKETQKKLEKFLKS